MNRQAIRHDVNVCLGQTTLIGENELNVLIERTIKEFSRACPRKRKTIVGIHKEVHKVGDTSNKVTVADAVATASACTLLNDIKAKHNAHIATTTYHRAADVINTITATNATDLATGIVLATEMITDLNGHQIQTLVHMVDDETNTVLSLPPVDQITLVDVVNLCKQKHNYHLAADTDGRTVYVQEATGDASFIRFEGVEYPVGYHPASRPLFDYHSGNFLKIETDVPTLTTRQLVYLFWQSIHSVDDKTSTVPVEYDPVIILGVEAYSMLFCSMKQYLQAIIDSTSARTSLESIDLTDANTALGNVTTYVADADTALDKVIEYLEGVTNSSKKILQDIGTDGVRTAVDTALTSAKASLDKVVEATTGDLDLAVSKLGSISMTEIDTAIAAMVAEITAADSTLDKVAIYLEGATDSSKASLVAITTDIANLKTAINTALDACKTALDAVSTATTGDIDLAKEKIAAVTMTEVETALDASVTHVSGAEAALVKVGSYLDGVSDSAKKILQDIGTDGVRTAVNAALTSAKTSLDKVVAATTGDLDVAVAKLASISMTEINTALTNMVAEIAASDTALDKVTTYMEGATEGAVKALKDIVTDAADLKTAINTAVDSCKDDLGKVTVATTGDIDLAKEKIAAVEMTDVETALDAVATHVTGAETALAKVSTYLETNADGNAKLLLEGIKTDMAGLKTAINTAVDACNTQLDLVPTGELTDAPAVWTDQEPFIKGVTVPSGDQYLKDWDDMINTVNVGDEVPALGAQYSASALEIAKHYADKRKDILEQAGRRTENAATYLNEATARLSHLRTYVDQSTGWGEIAISFVNEASQRLLAADERIKEAVQRLEINVQLLEQADGYLVVAEKRQQNAIGYCQESSVRINHLRTYLEQSEGWGVVAQTFIAEAIQRLAQANVYSNEVQARIMVNQSYIDQCVACLDVAEKRVGVAVGFLQEGTIRMDNLRSYIEQAGGWEDIAMGFANEATQHFVAADERIKEAVQRLAMNVQSLEQAAAHLVIAEKRQQGGIGYCEEATTRIDHLRTYLEQSEGWDAIAQIFITEAVQRLAQANVYANEIQARIQINLNYIDQSAAHLGVAEKRIGVANGFFQESSARLTNLSGYLEESGKWGDIAATFISEAAGRLGMSRGFVEEATQRIASQAVYIQEGERYIMVIEGVLMMGESFRREGQGRLRRFTDTLARIEIEQAIREKPQNLISNIWLDD